MYLKRDIRKFLAKLLRVYYRMPQTILLERNAEGLKRLETSELHRQFTHFSFMQKRKSIEQEDFGKL